MRRRDFFSLLCGAAASPASVTAWSQERAPIVGFLHGASPSAFMNYVEVFRKALAENGYIDHRNVSIEYRWAEGQYDRLPSMAADLVRQQVDLIVAAGGIEAARAAKAATSTIPIVFSVGNDPVAEGIVESLGRPGGNATGVYLLISNLDPKKLSLLHDLLPHATTLAAIYNPRGPTTLKLEAAMRAATQSLGCTLLIVHATQQAEIDAAFSSIAAQNAGGLVVGADPFLNSQRDHVVALAARYRIPAIYEGRAFAEAGGLMSYGTSLLHAYHQVGIYAGRILKGAKPADLPVLQESKFEFLINLRTARALGITVPPTLLARTDEVIE